MSCSNAQARPSWHGATQKQGHQPPAPAQARGDPAARLWVPGLCRNTLLTWLSLPRHAFLPIPLHNGELCSAGAREGPARELGGGSWGSVPAVLGETPITLVSRQAGGKRGHKTAKKKKKKAL